MASFTKSAEFNYAIAGVGALAGVYTTPIIHSALPKGIGAGVADLVIGAAAFIGGMYVGHDGVSAFLVGFGITYLVEGLLRFVMPNATPFNSVAVASTSAVKATSGKTASGNWF